MKKTELIVTFQEQNHYIDITNWYKLSGYDDVEKFKMENREEIIMEVSEKLGFDFDVIQKD